MRNVVHHEVQSITTAEKQALYLDGTDASAVRGKRVCLIDDVISTGESIAAVEELVHHAGFAILRTAGFLPVV